MRLGQGLVSQNPWRSPPPPLFFCLCLVLNPRYQTSRRPPILPLHHPPISSCFLPTLCALPTTHLAAPSRWSSSVPTWLGLRPITCLPVIRCCANPAFQVNSLCSRRFKTYEISLVIPHQRYRCLTGFTLSLASLNDWSTYWSIVAIDFQSLEIIRWHFNIRNG